MPQKHPPASTAVSSPVLCGDVSAAGGGIVTAGSAFAASGEQTRAAATRTAERCFMACVPRRWFAFIYERNRWLASHKITRLRERCVIGKASSWPGLSRPSTSCLLLRAEDVDARHKAGHDVK